MSLTGSEFQSSGEVNSIEMLKSGTSYVAHDLDGDNAPFSGSYAPVSKGVHQCGGKRKSQRKSQRKGQRKSQRKGPCSSRKTRRQRRRRN